MGLDADQELAAENLNALAVTLVQQAAALSRVMFGRLQIGLSRTEAGVMARLEAGPQRITTLADLDGLAQPTVTLLVKRLEGLGLVQRERSVDDGRVVLVSLTESGREEIESIRLRYRNLLREHLDVLPGEDLAALESAIRVMGTLVERIQTEELR